MLLSYHFKQAGPLSLPCFTWNLFMLAHTLSCQGRPLLDDGVFEMREQLNFPFHCHRMLGALCLLTFLIACYLLDNEQNSPDPESTCIRWTSWVLESLLEKEFCPEKESLLELSEITKLSENTKNYVHSLFYWIYMWEVFGLKNSVRCTHCSLLYSAKQSLL